MSDDVNRLATLFELAQNLDLTDEQLLELDALERKYPDWLPADVQPSEAVQIARVAETFTKEELELIAKTQRTNLKGMKYRWIIQRANAHYVIGMTGEYMAPIGKQDLPVSLRRDLARLPCVSAEMPADDGSICWDKMAGERVVRKSVDEMLYDYSTVARSIEASMAVPYSYYDADTETFFERVCPLRRGLEAVYHAGVDQWLTYLGGAQSEKLKDWMAVAPRLGSPVCAVYLHGSRDAGKSMFATGMAKLWYGSATPFKSAFSEFNSMIATNPLIFADEELPKKMSSGFLREFIAQDSHSLRRKGIPEAKLTGCFRVVIAANNEDLFKFDEEQFSAEDVAAIAGRVLYIKCDDRAATFLRERGGRAFTEDWVSGNKIAEHALWLSQNRMVKVGPRFLVEGDKIDKIHRAVATGGAVRGMVVEWICKAMIKNTWLLAGKANERGIQFGGGRIYVNTSFVQSTWGEVMGDDRVPSLKSIGKALRPLAIPDELGRTEKRLAIDKFRRADFYHIDPQHIYETAEQIQLDELETYKALVAAPRAWIDLVRPEGGDPVVSVPEKSRGLFDASFAEEKKK